MLQSKRITIPDRSGPGLKTTATAIGHQQGGCGVKTTVGDRKERGRVKGGEVVRIGSCNVGTMSKRGRELADLMERRRINIMCVQETKWKGAKAKELGGGFKLFYNGVDGKRNGVGIILDRQQKQNVLGVERVSDRVIWMRMVVNNEIVNVISAYAPQSGCSKQEKEIFWMDMDETTGRVNKEERIFIGADLNGHVGEGNQGDERWMGKHGYGKRNEEGEEIISFVTRADLAVINTFFEKRNSHKITYKSGGGKSQIDYLLCWRKNLKEVSDCKSIQGESVVPQHKPVVGKVCFGTKRKREKRGVPKIRWWKLKEKEHRETFVDTVMARIGPNFPKDWKVTSSTIHTVARDVLGESSGRIKADKETWWWNEEVQVEIKKKKETKRLLDSNNDEAAKLNYKASKKATKRAVAKAKASAYQSLYENLETKDGQKNIYRIAKQRAKDTKDIQHIKMIKDENGKVLTKDKEIKERWKSYYDRLMNEENPREKRKEDLHQTEGLVDEVSKEEVWSAVRKMKNGKAVGLDGIPAEVWKVLGDMGCNFLCWLFNGILKGKKMPDEWRESVMVPIYKNKGDVQNCGNYRGIKLMSHTMKIWERVIDRRIRMKVDISEEQFGFMAGRSTTDAIFALRTVIEKHREKEKELHCIFIDLEKAYDRVPREEVWHCLHEKGVGRKYIGIIQDMYMDSKTVVKTAVGQTTPFNVKVGLHQGSVLSPLLFSIVIDVLTQHIRRKAPWNMMYADDVVLLNHTKDQAEKELENWREALEKRGLRISRSKTEYLCIGQQSEMPALKMGGDEIPKVKDFKYLGSTVEGNGGCEMEVKKRIQAGWNSWRNTTGVMCDKRIPAKLKGRVFNTVIRPAMMYGLETLPLTKAHEKSLEVAEMRMLRWSLGWTKKDRVRNDKIRRMTNVGQISVKARESRLRWFGHVKRRHDGYVGKEVLKMEVDGKRKRGRPRRRWMDVVNEDMREVGLEEEDAMDRNLWKCGIHYSNPADCRTS